jgi:hypothetical protein
VFAPTPLRATERFARVFAGRPRADDELSINQIRAQCIELDIETLKTPFHISANA